MVQAASRDSHTPVPHELRRAWLTAKKLAEELETADLRVEQRIVVYVREQILLALMAVEGYVEVSDRA